MFLLYAAERFTSDVLRTKVRTYRSHARNGLLRMRIGFSTECKQMLSIRVAKGVRTITRITKAPHDVKQLKSTKKHFFLIQTLCLTQKSDIFQTYYTRLDLGQSHPGRVLTADRCQTRLQQIGNVISSNFFQYISDCCLKG